MDLRPDELIAAFRATPDALDVLLDGVSNETAERAGPDADDDWSMAAIVSHLVYAEQVQNPRLARLLVEDQPRIASVPDNDDVVRPLDEGLRAFGDERRAAVALLESIGESEWDRGGIHKVKGPLSIRDIVTHQVAHDLEHLGQIARRLRLLRELAD